VDDKTRKTLHPDWLANMDTISMKSGELMGERVIIVPDRPIRAGEWGTWQIIYTAGCRGLAIGGGMMVGLHQQLLPVFHLEGDWTPFQCDQPEGPGYVTAHTTGKAHTRIEVITANRIPGLPEPTPRLLKVIVEDGPLRPGEELWITLGDTSQNSPGMRAQMIAESGLEFLVSVDYEGTDCWDSVLESPILEVLGGPVDQLRVVIPSVPQQGKAFPLSVHALDAFGHPASDVNEESHFTILGNQDSKQKLTKTPVMPGVESGGFHRVEVAMGEHKAESNPVWVTEDVPEYNLYWISRVTGVCITPCNYSKMKPLIKRILNVETLSIHCAPKRLPDPGLI